LPYALRFGQSLPVGSLLPAHIPGHLDSTHQEHTLGCRELSLSPLCHIATCKWMDDALFSCNKNMAFYCCCLVLYDLKANNENTGCDFADD
jgi:hypothetical protein